MHKCRIYGPDKLNLWPFYHLTFKCDLGLQPNWTNVSNDTFNPQGEQLCHIILKSMHKYRRYSPEKLNHLTFSCDLDLQPTWTNVSNGTATPQEEQLCHIILKSMHKYRSYGTDKLNLWPFYHLPSSVTLAFCRRYSPDKLNHLTFSCDLVLQPTWTNVLNGTATPQEEQLCHIILKSMHKCRSYGTDKLNLLPFYHLTFKSDLDLPHTWINVSNGTATPQGEQLCQIILKPMHNCRSYGWDKRNICDFQVWHWPSTYLKCFKWLFSA